jgi:DNA-binding SARP family transcriptional activator/Tfp pilus assembly protein PilF
MPSKGGASALLGYLTCRFPHQRAIREDPDRIVAQSCQDFGSRLVVVGNREADQVGIAGRLRDLAVAESDKVRRQGHQRTKRQPLARTGRELNIHFHRGPISGRTSAVPHCNLILFGGWSLTGPGGSALSLPTRKDRQLLAYLAAQPGRPHGRERLASLLWSDRAEEQARDSLRQSLAALRRTFRAAGVDALKTDRTEVSVDATALSTDVVTFAAGCIGSAPSAGLAGLYRGSFLEGLEASTPEFERWVAQERQRLAALAEQLVCTASISVLSPGDREAALQLGRSLLAEDPVLESVYRATMRLHRVAGDRVYALKVYATCRDTLRAELGVEPDHETERLYREVLTDDTAAPTSPEEVRAELVSAKPSIAILPFANLTGNDRLNFLCEGLAEDVSTGLGRFRSLFVIDRYSAATVAAATADTVEIGKRLGAAALVQGSIQASASRLRITVRLVDSASRAQTWSDVFECASGDAPGIPDQIVSAIIATVHNRLENTVVDHAKGKPSLAAYEFTMRGIKHLRGYAADDNEKALALFREALKVDSHYALAQAYLAFAEVVANNYDAAPHALLVDCKTRIDQALAIDPDDGRIHWLLAYVHGFLREFDDERRQLERALELNPNDANARVSYGVALAGLGQHEAGVRHIQEAMRLNPFHPESYWVALSAMEGW